MTPFLPEQFRQVLRPDDFDFIKLVESEMSHGDFVRLLARLAIEDRRRRGELPETLTVGQFEDLMKDQITAIATEYEAEMSAIDEEAGDA